MTEVSLETQGLSRHFGALTAVNGIDFKLAAGARHALIGPNGAGKTTFINLLTGVISPTHGRVLLAGRDITAAAQAERVKLGIARTFQINRLFRGLSVLENVCIPVAERVGAAPSMFYPAGKRVDVIEESMGLLATLKLDDGARERLDLLAQKANEGQLGPEEAREYERFIELGDILATLRLKAERRIASLRQ